jgi:hypothetical protein
VVLLQAFARRRPVVALDEVRRLRAAATSTDAPAEAPSH